MYDSSYLFDFFVMHQYFIAYSICMQFAIFIYKLVIFV